VASSFKNAHVAISTTNTDTTLYQAQNVIATICHGLYITNKHASANIQVTVKVIDSSSSNAEMLVLHKVPIPPNSTLSLDKPLNLEVNDIIKIASTNTECEAFASLLEQT